MTRFYKRAHSRDAKTQTEERRERANLLTAQPSNVLPPTTWKAVVGVHLHLSSKQYIADSSYSGKATAGLRPASMAPEDWEKKEKRSSRRGSTACRPISLVIVFFNTATTVYGGALDRGVWFWLLVAG